MKTPTPEIRKAFYARLLEMIPFMGIGENDIAWPNSGFVPNPEKIYLAPFVLFNETQTATLSPEGYEKLAGIFQVSICGLPKSGEGNLDEIARAVTDHFRGGTEIDLCQWQSIRIMRSWRSPLMYDGEKSAGRPTVAVSCEWQQFTPKGE